jgi:hypothetical protein
MASQEQSPFNGLVTSWPALAAMAITMLSFLAVKPNLESPRPTSVGVVHTEPFLASDVPARLWQDPLGSVLNGPFQGKLNSFTNGMPGGAGAGDAKVLVLLAFVDLEMTPEQIETRRRERFAALAALNTAGYVPVKSDRISYVDLEYVPEKPADKPVQKSAAPSRYRSQTQSKNLMPQLWKTESKNTPDDAKDTKLPLRVAFEWLRPLKSNESISTPPGVKYPGGVCMVWFGEDIDPTNSLRSLMFVKKTIAQSLGKPASAGSNCEFALIGRIESDKLASMFMDDELLKDDAQARGGLKDLVLYVTYATRQSLRKNKNVTEETLSNSQLHLKYVIGSDDLLLSTLVAELENRGVSTIDDHIALISEWDTSYGRAMDKEFLTAAGFQQKRANVFQYSYLRGLDGKLPVKTVAASDNNPPGTKDAKPADAPADTPGAQEGEGDAQVDYLRRLVERLKAQRQPLRAIGVLGSDTYDKLLILRALRPSFPKAVLFTTDLDVRLLQPADYAATRNLIIAAHFGLALDKQFQEKTAPFRSSYDTASYLGYLLAVQCPLLETVPAQSTEATSRSHKVALPNNAAAPLPVHLYEVGRYGAFELTSYTPQEDPLGARNFQRDRQYFSKTWWHLAAVPLFAVLLGLLLLTVSRNCQRLLLGQPKERPRDGSKPPWAWRRALFIAALIAAALLIAAVVYSHYHPNQEPFSMVDGLSLWPTIAFRLFAIGLCVYYFFKTLEDLAKRDEEIRQEFGLPRSTEPAAPSLAQRRWLSRHLYWACGMWFWCPDDEMEQIPEVWQQFEEFGRTANRLYRSATILVINLALWALLEFLTDAVVIHGRGDLARWTGRISLYLAGLALVFLLIFAVDATVLCYRFVTYLGRCRYRWPPALVAKFAAERGLKPTEADTDPARAALNELIRVRLIASATYVASRLVFDPFVILLVLVVAQSPLFVPWQWNIPQFTIGLVGAGTALGCAVILQRSAKDGRAKAVEALDRILLQQTGQDAATRKKVSQVRAELNGMDTGVFAGFANNPVVHALLLPLGGGGGLAALEALLPHL